MNAFSMPRRQALLWAASALAVTACAEKKPAFSGIDITGADFANAFSLPDHNGQPRTLADFKGQVVVLFFGFIQCPDVCPTSLAEMAQARRLLGADAARMQGLFISVDPQRDRPPILREYVGNFDPTFLALYASADVLPALAKSFRIHYRKIPGPTPTSYTMDHSAGSYVYDPQGRLRLYHRFGGGAQALASDLKLLLSGA